MHNDSTSLYTDHTEILSTKSTMFELNPSGLVFAMVLSYFMGALQLRPVLHSLMKHFLPVAGLYLYFSWNENPWFIPFQTRPDTPSLVSRGRGRAVLLPFCKRSPLLPSRDRFCCSPLYWMKSHRCIASRLNAQMAEWSWSHCGNKNRGWSQWLRIMFFQANVLFSNPKVHSKQKEKFK